MDGTVADTDGDGLSDLEEFILFQSGGVIFVFDDVDSDGILGGAFDADSDNDGFLDGAEVSFGSDPLDPTSDPTSFIVPEPTTYFLLASLLMPVGLYRVKRANLRGQVKP